MSSAEITAVFIHLYWFSSWITVLLLLLFRSAGIEITDTVETHL